ncbi:WYL domain-containing protein [Gordonia amarae]|uniref:WYL domain-containing protein n=2 Tax=Gordonia amarae TaxID=36821 RepID=A0A857LUM9_9ACTN|nr:WYL domain-containing protein [Gordonia amarae]MCS3879372.1 putative DNA-binding transcriptional regulator YafY [Gordonia amarae]QHN17850.1 WYL domain-containing protein [Gordonia amarae]QHN22381.1 WYL domain-containing protein [Gordonia amarae]QHN31257.1 WYL domain-containing protein [Gordonia amarae]QHN40002.1 WYL domain-containing protein [Gordonia amarae]
MRADRLLAVLMLLKARGRLTAGQIADELEVSERTVLRDIEALSLSGVPVYAERGRNGGFALLPGYRTDLSGLTLDEATSLIASGGRVDSPAFASAIRKVSASLPDAFRTSAVRAAQRILVRPEGFVRLEQPLDALGPVQQAVFDGRRIRVRYRRRGANAPAERTLDPIGLIVAGGTWYLVAGATVSEGRVPAGSERMYRLSRITDVVILDEPARRPDEVDLEEIWQRHRSEFRAGFTTVPVVVRCAATTLKPLSEAAQGIVASRELGGDRVEVTCEFVGEQHAINVLWVFVADLEVIGPPAVRDAISDRVAAMAALYTGEPRPAVNK